MKKFFLFAALLCLGCSKTDNTVNFPAGAAIVLHYQGYQITTLGASTVWDHNFIIENTTSQAIGGVGVLYGFTPQPAAWDTLLIGTMQAWEQLTFDIRAYPGMICAAPFWK